MPLGSEPATALLTPPASVAEVASSFATGGVLGTTLMVKSCWVCSVPSDASTVMSKLVGLLPKTTLLGSATVTTPVVELMVKPPPEVSPTSA